MKENGSKKALLSAHTEHTLPHRQPGESVARKVPTSTQSQISLCVKTRTASLQLRFQAPADAPKKNKFDAHLANTNWSMLNGVGTGSCQSRSQASRSRRARCAPSHPETQASAGAAPALRKNAFLLSVFLYGCLSRACLDKLIVFMYVPHVVLKMARESQVLRIA